MNIISLLQLLKDMEGGSEFLKEMFEFAIKINTHRRIFERIPLMHFLNSIDIARVGYGKTVIFAGTFYETAMQFPSAFLDLSSKDIMESLLKLFPNLKKDSDVFNKKFNADITDVNANNIFLKLAKSFCKLKLEKISEEEGYDFCRKALKIYAPSAHKLGMHQLKDELEVLSFNFLYPKEAAELNKFVLEYYKNSNEIINLIEYKLKKELTEDGINYISIKGRKKYL